jgi:DNA-binding beta-propeller fold protein YncE
VIRTCVALGVVTVSLACSTSAAARPPFGALAQLPGRDGCTGVFFDSCRPGTLGGQRVFLSPGERFLYVGSAQGSVAGYARNSHTGGVRSLPGARGCVVGSGTAGEVPAASVCTEWDLLGPALEVNVAISPDGRQIYFGSGGLRYVPPSSSERPATLATLERDTTGRLRPAGCTAAGVAECVPARGMDGGVSGVAISPDGKTVYVTSSVELGTETETGSSVAVFAREPASGVLSQLSGQAGCIAPAANAGCGTARGLNQSTSSVAISPDGGNVYVSTSANRGFGDLLGTILAFDRDPVTGALEQLPGAAGCLASDGRDGCREARPLGSFPDQLPELAVSPDGENVYAPFVTAAGLSGGITVLRRDPSTGALAQPAGVSGCVSQQAIAGCRRGRALELPTGVSVSRDGRNVYVSASNSAAIAVFARLAGGALRQPPGAWGCIGSAPLFDEGCASSPPVREDITLSDDGRYGYVAGEDGLTVFARNGPRVRVRVARRCTSSGLPIGVRIWTWGGLRRAVVRFDRRLIAIRARRRFRVVIPTARLASRRHRLSVLATDRSGRKALQVRRVAGCRGD